MTVHSPEYAFDTECKEDRHARCRPTSPSPGAQVAHGNSHLAYTYLYAVTATKYEIKLVANE